MRDRAADKELLELLNKPSRSFTNQDLIKVINLLDQHPGVALAVGSHRRSTIWICAQHSDCPYRRNILPPLLVEHGANVDQTAGNGNTPLLSLYTAYLKNSKKKQDHTKRQMAVVLTQVCGARVPYDDRNGKPSNIQEWLMSKPQLNLEELE